MKAIGYIRVSTEEQSADDKYGIEVQKQAISDYADRNDFEIVCWLTDTISGATVLLVTQNCISITSTRSRSGM